MDELKIKQSIKRSREECNLTQKELAEKVGISTNAYAEIESGKTRIFNENLPKIALETGRSFEKLVWGFNPDEALAAGLGEAEKEFNQKISDIQGNYERIIQEKESHISSLSKENEFLKKELDNKNSIIAKLLEK